MKTTGRDTRLVFALILGILVFSERQDAMTLVGSLVIVLSGVYSLMTPGPGRCCHENKKMVTQT